MKTVALVALLICVVGAIDISDTRQCSAYCKESSNFQYEVGKTYVYDYSVDTVSAISRTSREESRLHLAASAEISVLSQCDFRLQLHNVVLKDSLPHDGTQRSSVPRQEEFSAALEENPLHFSSQDGSLDELCPATGDPTWVLNIKRGVLSAFQSSGTIFKRPETVVYERDVTGVCETRYSASSGTLPVMVRKTKDLLSCTHRLDYFLSLQSTPYSSPVNVHSLPLVQSQHSCDQIIGEEGFLKKSVCNEIHLFRPFSNGENGAMTKVSQYLLHKTTIDDVNTKDSGPLSNIRTTLLYQHNKDVHALTGEEDTVMLILQEIGNKTINGVQNEVPGLFSQLVASLNTIQYPQLIKVFSSVQHTPLRKFLLDALPLVETTDEITLVVDLYESKEITETELDSWLNSLAYQKRPSLNMLAAVSTLLDVSPRPKTILSISTLVHSYCKIHSSCLDEAVQDVMVKIERLLGSRCQPKDAKHMELIIVALKGIGNAGVVVNSENTLKKCYQMENPIEIRLAAIQAYRRLSCDTESRSHLLDTYIDMRVDTEVRIAAYLAAMQCPSTVTLRMVKDVLYREDVNQVASFVWTHLTNMQETSSRWKQGIKSLISNDFLKNKFSTDVRKFSRNYEASTYFDSLNAGAAVESNVIFTPQSYLPRSAMLNLTLDLFGESFNMLEVGGRAEGFEDTVEDIFGPGGYFPDSSVKKFLQNFREKEENELDNSIDKLSVVFDAKGKLQKEPKASLYARVFGNELHYSTFRGLDGIIGKTGNKSYEDYMIKLSLGEMTNFMKSFSLIDASYVIPTAAGLPLEFSVNGSATVGLKSNGHIKLKDISKSAFTLDGELVPSVVAEITGTMSMNAFVAKSGIRSVNKLHTNTYLGGVLKIAEGKVADVKINMPREKLEILDVSTNLLILHRDAQHVIEGILEDREEYQGCSPDIISEVVGVKLCGTLSYANASQISDAPYFPLTGPFALQLSLLKTDTFNSYEFGYNMNPDPLVSSININFDTPGSQIDRKFQVLAVYDGKKSGVSLNLHTPFIKVETNGTIISDSGVMKMDGYLSIDGVAVLQLNSGIHMGDNGNIGYYEPYLTLSYNERQVIDLGGRVHYIPGVKYSADLNLRSPVHPIFITGDLNLQDDGYLLNGAINSSFVRGSIEGAYRQVSDYISSYARVQYSNRNDEQQTIEITNKVLMSRKGEADLKSIQSSFKMSENPVYNTYVNWELKHAYNLFSHKLSLGVGNTKWDTAQVYRQRILGQHIDFQLLAMLLCRQKGIDYKLDIKHQTTDISLVSHAIAHLGVKRKYVASLEYLRNQDGDDRDLAVELSYSGFNATLNGKISETQLSTYEGYLEGKFNMKTAGIRNNLKLSGMYADRSTEVNQDHIFSMSLTGKLSGELSGGFLASENYAQQWVQVSAYGKTFRQGIVYTYIDFHNFDLTLQIGNQIYNASAIIKNTEEEKGVTVNLFFTKPLTFSAKLLGYDTMEVELAWNKNVNSNNRIYLFAKSTDYKSEFAFVYPGQRISGELFTLPTSVSGEVQWSPRKKVAGIFQWNVGWKEVNLLARLETPWPGLEKQVVSADYKTDGRQANLEVEMAWQNKSVIFLASGERNRAINNTWDVSATFEILSPVNTLSNMTFKLNHTRGNQIVTKALFIYNDQETSLSLRLRSTSTRVIADIDFISPWFSHPINGRIISEINDEQYSSSIEAIWAPDKNITSNVLFREDNPFTLFVQIDTPFDGYKKFAIDLLFANSYSERNIKSKFTLNNQEILLDVIIKTMSKNVQVNGTFSTPFSPTFKIQFDQSNNLWKKMSICYGDRQLFSLNETNTVKPFGRKNHFSVMANFLNQSISYHSNTEWNSSYASFQLSTAWNSKTLSINSFSKVNYKYSHPEIIHYHVDITGSVLRRELEMDLKFSMDYSFNTTLQLFAGDVHIIHTFQAENLLYWRSLLKVQTPLKSGVISIQSTRGRNNLIHYEMMTEVNGKQSQIQIDVATYDFRIERAVLTMTSNAWTHPIKIEYASSAENRIIRSHLNFYHNNEMKFSIKSSGYFRLSQASFAFELVSPFNKPVNLIAEYDIESSTKHGIVRLHQGNNTAMNTDFNFDSLQGSGSMVIKTSNSELFKLKTNYDFNNINETANFEATFGGQKVQATIISFLNLKYQMKLQTNTYFTNWQNVIVLGEADFLQPDKLITFHITKNSDTINLSASANLDPALSMINISVETTLTSIPAAYIYGSYDRRSSNNQIVDLIYVYNKTKTEFNGHLQHDVKNFVDAGLLEIVLKSHLKGFEHLAAHVSYNNKDENMQRMTFSVLKNNCKLQIVGETKFDNFESNAKLNIDFPFGNVEKISASLNHRIISSREQTVNIIVSCNDKNVEVNSAIVSSGNELLANMEIITPEGFENITVGFNLAGIVRQHKSVHLTLLTKNQSFKLSGTLNITSLLKIQGVVQAKFPKENQTITGALDYDLLGMESIKRHINTYLEFPRTRYEMKMFVDMLRENKMEAELTFKSPVIDGKIICSYEVNPSQLRASLNILSTNIHCAVSADIMLQESHVSAQVVCPLLGLNNLSFSGEFSLKTYQKTAVLIFVKNDQVFKIEGVLGVSPFASEIQFQVTTPINNWERINIHGRYNISNEVQEMKLVAVKGESAFDVSASCVFDSGIVRGSIDVLQSSLGTISVNLDGYSVAFHAETNDGEKLVHGQAAIKDGTIVLIIQTPFTQLQNFNFTLNYATSPRHTNMEFEYQGIGSLNSAFKLILRADTKRTLMKMNSLMFHPFYEEATTTLIYDGLFTNERKPNILLTVSVNRTKIIKATANLDLDWKNQIGVDLKMQTNLEVKRKFNLVAKGTPKFPPRSLQFTLMNSLGTLLDFKSVISKVFNGGFTVNAFMITGYGEKHKSVMIEYYPRTILMKASVNIVNGNTTERYGGVVTFQKPSHQLKVSISLPIAGYETFVFSWKHGMNFLETELATPFIGYEHMSISGALNITQREKKVITFLFSRNNNITGFDILFQYGQNYAETLFDLMTPLSGLEKFRFVSQYDIRGRNKSAFVRLESNNIVYKISGEIFFGNITTDCTLHIFTPIPELKKIKLMVRYNLSKSLNKRLSVYGDFNDVQHINLNFELTYERYQGKFIFSSQSPIIDTVFTLRATYDFSENAAVHSVEGNISLLDIEGSTSIRFSTKENLYKHGVLMATFKRRNVRYATEMGWDLNVEKLHEKSIFINIDTSQRVVDIRAALNHDSVRNLGLSVSSLLPTYGLNSFSAEWNTLQGNKVEYKLETYWHSVKIIELQSSFQLSRNSVTITILFNSSFQNFEEFAFIHYSNGFTSESMVRWGNVNQITLSGSFIYKQYTVDTKMKLSSSFMEPLLLTMNYNFNSLKQTFDAKFVYGSKKIQIDFNYLAPEFILIITSPIKGFSYIHFKGKLNFNRIQKSINMIYTQEDYTTTFEVNVTTEGPKIDLSVSLITPINVLKKIVFNGKYIRFSEVSATLNVNWAKGKNIIGKWTFLPYTMILQMNSTLSGWEHINIESVFLQNKARFTVRRGNEIVDLNSNIIPYNNGTSYLEMSLATPWTENFKLKGIHEETDDHLLHITYQYGKQNSNLRAKVSYVINDNQFVINTEAMLNEIGKLTVNVGYNKTSSMNTAFLTVQVGTLRLFTFIEGIQNEQNLVGRFHLESPFENMKKINANLEINFTEGLGVIALNKNDIIYEIHTEMNLSHNYCGGWLTLHSPNFHINNATLDIHFNNKSINISAQSLGKQINIQVGYELQQFLFSFDTLIEVPFIPSLEHILLSVNVNTDNVSGHIKGKWSRNEGIVIVTNFNSTDLLIIMQTPFEKLHDVQLSGKLKSRITRHELTGHVIWEQFKVEMNNEIETESRNYAVRSLLKWNDNTNITLQGNLTIPDKNNPEIHSQLNLRMPFNQFNYLDVKFTSTKVNERKTEYNFMLSTSETINPSVHSTLLLNQDKRNNVKVTFVTKLMDKQISVAAVLHKDTPQDMKGKLDILIPFGNIPPIVLEGRINLRPNEEHAANIQLKLPDSVYVITGSFSLLRYNLLTKLTLQTPRIKCNVSIGGSFTNNKYQAVTDINVNNNIVTASYILDQSSLRGGFNMDIPALNIKKSDFNMITVYNETDVHIMMRYKYHKHENEVQIRFQNEPSVALFSSVSLNFPYFLGKNPLSGNFNMKFGVPIVLIEGFYGSGKLNRSASLKIDNDDDKLSIVGNIPGVSVGTGSLLLKKNGELVHLKLADLLQAELSMKSTSGHIILSFPKQQHKLQYYIQSDNGIECNIEFESSLLRSGKSNILISYRNTETNIAKVNLISGEQHHSFSIELETGELNAIKILIISNNKTILGLQSSLLMNEQNFQGDAILDVYGIQNTVLIKHKMTFPLDSELKLISPLIPKESVEISLKTEESLLAYARYGDTKNGQYILLEATLLPEEGKLNMNLQTPVLSSIKSFTFNGECSFEDDELNFSVASVFSSSFLLPVELSLATQLSDTTFDGHFKLNLPIRNYEHYEGNVHIPLRFSKDTYLNVSLSVPQGNYLVSTTFKQSKQDIKLAVRTQYKEMLANATFNLSYSPRFLLSAEINTPFSDFNHYHLNLNGQTNLKEGNDVINYVQWNKKRIELRYSFIIEMKKFITEVKLITPFKNYDKYTMKLQYENNARKVAIATLSYPGLKKDIGIEFDYLYKGIFDINLIAQFNLPFLPGFGTASFLLGNKLNLGEGSYKAVISGHVNDKISSLVIEGLLNSEAANIEIQAHQNDKEIYLHVSSSWNSKDKLTLLWELRTPFPVVRNIKTFIHHARFELQFGTIYNSKEIIGLDLKTRDRNVEFEFRNPIRPISFSFLFSEPREKLSFSTEVCWDLNNKKQSEIGINLTLSGIIPLFFKFESQLKLPTRVLSYDVAHNMFSMFEHAMHFSWEEGKRVGYHIYLQPFPLNYTTYVRIDFPFRSFEGSMQNILDSRELAYPPSVIHHRSEFLWDAADDRSKKIAVMLHRYENESVHIVMEYAALPHDIIIQCSPHFGEDLVFGRDVTIVYSTIPEDVFTGGVYFMHDHDQTSLATGFSVHHVSSKLDINAKLSTYASTKGIGGKLNVTYMEPHTGQSNKLVSFVKVDNVAPELVIFFETNKNYLGLRGSIWHKKSGYYGASVTGQMNQEEPLTLSVALNTRETGIEVGVNNGASRHYGFRAQFPNWQEITAEASHSLNGINTVDGFVTLRLNTSQLLWTRVQWRPHMFQDLKPIIVQEYDDFVYVVNAIYQSYIQLFTENFEVNFPLITLQEITDYMTSEFNAIEQDFVAIGVDILLMYERNDFFLKDMCNFLKSTGSDVYALFSSMGEVIIDVISSMKKFVSHWWDALSLDSIIHTFLSIKNAIQEIIHAALQEMKGIAEVLNQLRVTLRHSVMDLVGQIRWQIYILSQHVAQISQDIELVVRSMKSLIKKLIEVTIEKVENHFRSEVWHTILKMSAMWSNITETIMSIPEVKSMQQAYLAYVTWLEEFHVQEYIDSIVNIVAQLVDTLVNDVLNVLNDIKLQLKGVTEPYLNEMEQVPVLLNIRSIINALYQKVSWIWKHYMISDRILNGVEIVLEQSDDMLLDLMVGMNTNFDQDSKTDLIFRPEVGLVEYTQEIPVDWNGFNELPKFEQFNWYSLEGKSEEHLSKLDRYSYFLVDPMNSIVNKSMDLLFPPFTKNAVMTGKSFFVTFDEKFYEFEGQCSYLLTTDFVDNKFSAIVNYDIQNQKIVKKSLTIISEGHHINIGNNNQVLIDNKKSELPVKIGESTWITRSGEKILVHTKYGMAIECNLHYDICTVELTGWYFGKTGGLLGTFDNEKSNDISLPDGTITPNIDFFANSWHVGKNSHCHARSQSVEEVNKPKPESHICARYFQHANSPLSSCFLQIDPQPYYEMCLRSGNTTCLSTATYVIQCKKVGVEIWMPAECVKCPLGDGTELIAGEQKLFNEENSPRTADVVLVVEQVNCLKSVRTIDMVTKLDGTLKAKGIDARYSVVGFGGNNFYHPHTRTANGEVWANRKSVDMALNGLEFDSEDSNEDVTVYDALWFASRLAFRGGASKTIVLIQCKACDEQEDYSDMLSVLQDNEITLHNLQLDAVRVGSSPDETANLFGMDKQGTYSGRNAKNLTPSKSLLKQVVIPKNLCTPLALETNGTLFNLNHLVGNKTRSSGKKFLDVWSHRVALTALPLKCHKCECVADRDSVGQMMCTKCLSPSIEDIAIMWSEEDLDPENYNE